MSASFVGIGPHFLYFFLALAVTGVFLALYLTLTPYREIKLIKEGNAAAAISLGGALLGFSIPLARAVTQSSNVVDMLIWSAVALVAQMLAYGVVRLLLPRLADDIMQGRTSSATLLAAVALSVGLLNAAAMTI